jgi:hypothetical protein
METIVYSSKKHNFCSKMCEMNYQLVHNMNDYVEQKMNTSNTVGENGAALFCSACGSALEQGARFCSKCGTKVK